MTDFIDRAAAREAEILDDSIAAQQRRADLAGKSVADSALTCVDCDEPIPEARRAAYPGVQRCVECKTLIEKQQKGHCARH